MMTTKRAAQIDSGESGESGESSVMDSVVDSVLLDSSNLPVLDSGARLYPLILFGGSFDPPHIGHMQIITALHAIAKRLVIIPAFRNPFKPAPIAPIQTRIAWLQTLCSHLPRAEVSDFEARAQKASKSDSKTIYAIEWVRHFAAECKKSSADSRPESSVESQADSRVDSQTDFGADSGAPTPSAESKPLLALGSDSLATLPRWKDSNELAKLVAILPIYRAAPQFIESKNLESLSHACLQLQAHGFTCCAPLKLRPYSISSSQIRAALARAKSNQLESAHIAHALPPDIAKHVAKIY